MTRRAAAAGFDEDDKLAARLLLAAALLPTPAPELARTGDAKGDSRARRRETT
jgi:hypothetical protein